LGDITAVLRIRPEQLQSVHQLMVSEYYSLLLQYYKRLIPEHTAPYTDESLLEIIKNCYQRGLAYKLHTAESMASFIGLAIVVDPFLDEHPTVRSYLMTDHMHPDVKLSTLCRSVVDRLALEQRNRPTQ
jgi:hypothetical protein